MVKKLNIVFIVLSFVLLTSSLVNAISGDDLKENVNPSVGVSEKNVKYEKQILDNFNFTDIEKEAFVKGNLKSILSNVYWVPIMVRIKDFSNISISNEDSVEVQTMKDNQRWGIYRNNMESVLSTLSEDEFKLESKSEFGTTFSGNITKQGFNKLLKDERIKKIYDNSVKGKINLAQSAPLINADNACNGIVAGTGNCSSTCEIILPPNDIYKFYVKNSTGNPVAWLGNLGNIILKGNCFSGGSCDSPGENSFIVGNSTDSHTAFINSTGDLCIEKGDCSYESATCNPMRNAFIIRNSSNANVSYIDFDGDLCLTGRLYENSIYV